MQFIVSRGFLSSRAQVRSVRAGATPNRNEGNRFKTGRSYAAVISYLVVALIRFILPARNLVSLRL